MTDLAKKALSLNANEFRTKIEDPIFAPTVRDGTATLCGLLYKPGEASSTSRGKGSTFISQLFLLRTRDITSDGLAPRIELAISSSAFKRCTNWANPAAQLKKEEEEEKKALYY